jgi:hypothetical protein
MEGSAAGRKFMTLFLSKIIANSKNPSWSSFTELRFSWSSKANFNARKRRNNSRLKCADQKGEPPSGWMLKISRKVPPQFKQNYG